MADTAATPETISLTIDGKAVTVPKGTNVLEAAKTVGIDISHFCYHPGLSAPAVCRQCLVDVKGAPKLVPSCYTPVADKMEVSTNNEKTLAARQQMLEFTLVNHPVDCPICDKAGECTLQKLYHEWDHQPSRITHEKVHKPKRVDLGPTIILDAERCILCTRCIRVCDEVAHSHQLEMAWRGDHQQLTTAPGKQLDHPYSLNTVDVCPVGALTSKDFRFSMRAWELNATQSICTGCATGCNIEIHHARGEIHRLVPRENQAVNKFWMCDEGRMTYKEIRDRRTAGATLRGAPTSLDKALNFAAERLLALKQAQSMAQVGVVLNAQASNEDNWLLLQTAQALGISRIYTAGKAPVPGRADNILRHADVNPNSAGLQAMLANPMTMKQLSTDLGTGGLKGVWILGGNVALSDGAKTALSKLDLVIYQTAHSDELAELAQLVLPSAAWAEFDGTITNAQGMVQRLRCAIEPPGDALPHHELVARLGERLGIARKHQTVHQLFQQMKQAVPAFANANYGRELPVLQLRFAGSRG